MKKRQYRFLSSLKVHLVPVKLMLTKYIEKTMAIVQVMYTLFCGQCVMEEIQRTISKSMSVQFDLGLQATEYVIPEKNSADL